jgi:protein TonB
VRQPEPLVPVTGDEIFITPAKVNPNVSPGESAFAPEISLDPGSGPGGRIGPVMPVELDNAPRTRFQAAPHYPLGAKTAGLTGEVLVEFIVDENGHVIDPHVRRSTDRVFEESTLRAVAKWQFEPGRRAGRIVRFRMAVPVVFNLND